jgi:hypothetical protein
LEEKIGERLKIQPLDDTADFIDLELWKMDDTQRNERFIQQMKESYPDFSQFRRGKVFVIQALLNITINSTTGHGGSMSNSILCFSFSRLEVFFIANTCFQHRMIRNISLGNHHEIWHKHYSRQLPLAALIDELAFTFPHVVFRLRLGLPYTAPPSCEVPMTFELLSIAP